LRGKASEIVFRMKPFLCTAIFKSLPKKMRLDFVETDEVDLCCVFDFDLENLYVDECLAV